MKALKSSSQLMAEAKELEEASRLSEAAALYQQIADSDPADQKALPRLLTLYRRLKEPKKEIAVIDNALAAYSRRGQVIQGKWLSAHPKAAKAGRAFLRTMGGSNVSAFGSNPVVERLQKRRDIVEKKLHGKTKGKTPAKKSPAAAKKAAATQSTQSTQSSKQAAQARKQAAQRAAAELRQAAEARKQAANQKKQTAAAAKQKRAEERRLAAQARKKSTPSLFVISLRYLAPLDKIDAALPKHSAFLDKHLATGVFLVAGRQVPRTGGIIIARGKNRVAIERIMKQDPFLKARLASVDIVEFTPGKSIKKLGD